MSRRTTATTSIAAMQHNLAVIRRQAPGARIWAIVKADAYGHGLAAARRGFDAADGMALLEFDGAVRLRESGWTRPILMLEGPFEPGDVDTAIRHRLSLVVQSPHQFGWIEAAAAAGAPLEVWLKVNTGLNRLGVRPADALALAERIHACPKARLTGLMTHFASADVAGGADAPLAAIEALARVLRGAGLAVTCSYANSAAIFDLPAAQADWVRPGIALYGATPFDDRDAASLGLEPVMALTGSLIGIQSLAAGDAVGYGARFVAEAPLRIGIVDCGYADGYPRIAGTGTPVAVDGVVTRTVGRVSMDMLAVDLTPVPAAGIGTPVELWGPTVPVDAVAAAAGTVGYELLCAITPRVRRAVAG